ncbi:hypothetical protein MAR_024560 [Mya arenaria]|uniref:Uncharacterized protein n=1 Tax=Mya arenaria TaxID=6604 RepID=A0ABY7DU43_MYAAR|nr:hypothetical protein MAR_024470 [Mya arenaria]WAR00188.1 hypothetical protein MAR_024560 [Mya arenaria]
MPIRNHFPIFHKLKQGAYCYVWTDKCEKLLPKHYKNRCLEYMLREPTPVHWIPDPQKYRYDKYGQLVPKNHERDLNSKLAMDLQREMLVKLATESQESKLSPERQRVFNRYKQFMIPVSGLVVMNCTVAAPSCR